MLILTRKRDEVITIGPDIKVMIVAINGKQVKLGIIAPLDVAIHREDAVERGDLASGQ